MLKHWMIGAAVLAAGAAVSATAQAADCAVSGLNGSVAASAASSDTGASSNEVYDATLEAALPLGCRFGAQAEVTEVRAGGSNRTFAAGHLFARDPSKYLVGVTGGYLDGGSAPNLSYGAVEAEYYTDRWTVSALAGVANITSAIDKGLYGLSITYYPTDNIKVSLGDLHAFKQDLASVRAEWQPNNSRFSVFGEVSDDVGSAKLVTYKLGAKFAFGAAKTLKDRNRHDDPEPVLGTFGAWYNLTAAQIGVLQSAGPSGGLPVPVNGVCPAGFFYVPSLSTTQCFI